jgi:hypothetical protein
VDVHAAELGAAVQLRKNLVGVEDLRGVEGKLHALLLVQVVLVEHHRHQVVLFSIPTHARRSAEADRQQALPNLDC